MNRVVKYYLYFTPFFSLVGIVLGILRSAYHDYYLEEFLTVSAAIDLVIILFGFKCLFEPKIAIVLLLLIFSFLVGALNYNISRRFITDFTNPLFFFGKVFIFGKYWLSHDFKAYMKYYTRIAFTGSLILLPITYFLFKSTGSTRLAIFPPMELPFSNFLLSNSLLLLVSFFIILLYGKRAQLFSAVITLMVYTFFFKRREIVKYVIISFITVLVAMYLFDNYSDNLAVGRLKSTIDLYEKGSVNGNNLDAISAGRYNEFEVIVSQMKWQDYIIGKGIGFVYNLDAGTVYVETANSHFSPLGFISKYGLMFTIFVYYFIISIFLKTNKKLLSIGEYVVALAVATFVFTESFFAYAIFVTPILPIVLGVLISCQKKQKLEVRARRRASAAIPQTGWATF